MRFRKILTEFDSNTQLNLFDGGELSRTVDLGFPGVDTNNENIEANIFGGQTSSLNAFENTVLNVFGGSITGGIYNLGAVNISGGEMGSITNRGTVNISGGAMGTIYNRDDAIIMEGGIVRGSFVSYGGSNVLVRGGQLLGTFSFISDDGADITFEGNDFRIRRRTDQWTNRARCDSDD